MWGGGLQPKVIECKCIGGFGEKKSNNNTQWYQQDRVYLMGDVALCHPSSIPGGSYNYLEIKDIKIKQATKEGSIPMKVGGVFDGSYP